MKWWEILETVFYGILTPLIIVAIIGGLLAATLWVGGEFFEYLVTGVWR